MKFASPNDLSMARRIGLGLVGAAGLFMSTAISSLWVTEPTALPTATAVAFAVMVVVGLAWTVYAVWALTVRLPMFGRDRVIAWTIASAAAFASVVVVIAVGLERGWTVPIGAALAVSTVELCAASWLRHRSVRRHRTLLARRTELEAELGRK